jgi:putative ABC transport system permease protein
VPVYAVRSMRDVVAASPGVPARRVVTAAFTGFAALAVILGALGLFGIAAHDVASRRAELALRIALGADPRHLLRATLGQGALIVGCGLVAGSMLSIWTTRALATVFVGRDRFDVVGSVVAAAVLAIAGAAALLPAALRAARTDPAMVLRAE